MKAVGHSFGEAILSRKKYYELWFTILLYLPVDTHVLFQWIIRFV